MSAPREIESWDLSRAGHTLTVYWYEQDPSCPLLSNRRIATFDRDDEPWAGWAIQTVVAALAAGEQPADVAVPDQPPPLALPARLLGTAGDALFAVADWLCKPGRFTLAGVLGR